MGVLGGYCLGGAVGVFGWVEDGFIGAVGCGCVGWSLPPLPTSLHKPHTFSYGNN